MRVCGDLSSVEQVVALAFRRAPDALTSATRLTATADDTDMEESSSASMLRQVFAHINQRSGWTFLHENAVARLAVRAFVDEARTSGRPVDDVIIDAVALTGASANGVADQHLETIIRWAVEDFFARSHESREAGEGFPQSGR
jgi:hypothetical protein